MLGVREALGDPSDPPATAVTDTDSAFAYLKGIAARLGLPVGEGTALLNDDDSRHQPADLASAIGQMTDSPATMSAGDWSAIALLKGILAIRGV